MVLLTLLNVGRTALPVCRGQGPAWRSSGRWDMPPRWATHRAWCCDCSSFPSTQASATRDGSRRCCRRL